MLKRALLNWMIGVVAIVVTILIMGLLPKSYELRWDSIWGPVIFVPVLAVVNAIIGTVLRMVTVPWKCMTFGLISFLINAIVFWIAGSATGAQHIGFINSLIGSILYSVISAPLSAMIAKRD